MTNKDVLRNLEALIGKEIEVCKFENEIIQAFEDFQENSVTEVITNYSHNSGYDYIAYLDTLPSTQFLFKLNRAEDFITITEVWIW